MSLFLRHLLPVARSTRPCWTILSRGMSDIPVQKAPFWDMCRAPFWGTGQGPCCGIGPGSYYGPGPYWGSGWPGMHAWPNTWSACEYQQERGQKMEDLLAAGISPWRRLELNTGKEVSRPEPKVTEYGQNSEVIRTEMDKANLKMEMEFNVSQYEPSELFVYLAGDWVVISGRHGTRVDEGYVTRQFMRQIYIPEGLNKDTICGRYTENGNVALSVKAVSEEAFNKIDEMYRSHVEQGRPL